MAQQSSATSQSAAVPRDYQDAPPKPVAATFIVPHPVDIVPLPVDRPTSLPVAAETVDSAVLGALASAADRTAASIAILTHQAPAAIRSLLDEVIVWLTTTLKADAAVADSLPPVVAREYVSTLRLNFLAELDGKPGLDAGEVVRSLRKLDQAEEAWKRTERGQFISRLTGADCADAVVGIAHDIRSPLTSILLLVDSLRRAEKGQTNAIRERQLGLIYSAALGLSTTVSNLIDAARGDFVQGEPIAFSITEMMHTVRSIVLPMCEDKGVPLHLHFPERDVRTGHAAAIQQALLNLVSNALRYTDAGSVEMGCSELSADQCEFWVDDSGPGIPAEVLERLNYGFPPEGFKLRFSSAGLGLAIVRTLVEAMGSTLQIETGRDGTRLSFVLHLPRAPFEAL